MTELSPTSGGMNSFSPPAHLQNRGCKVRFFNETIGLTPAPNYLPMIVECVSIRFAGETLNSPVLPVTDELRERFPEEYAAFKANTDFTSRSNETKLSDWSDMPQDVVSAYEEYDVLTVEDLSVISDINVGFVIDGRRWRDKAIIFCSVEAARNRALDAENTRLRTRLAALEKSSKPTPTKRKHRRVRPSLSKAVIERNME